MCVCDSVYVFCMRFDDSDIWFIFVKWLFGSFNRMFWIMIFVLCLVRNWHVVLNCHADFLFVLCVCEM